MRAIALALALTLASVAHAAAPGLVPLSRSGGGGAAGLSPAVADLTYLRLDTTNDPLTGALTVANGSNAAPGVNLVANPTGGLWRATVGDNVMGDGFAAVVIDGGADDYVVMQSGFVGMTGSLETRGDIIADSGPSPNASSATIGTTGLVRLKHATGATTAMLLLEDGALTEEWSVLVGPTSISNRFGRDVSVNAIGAATTYTFDIASTLLKMDFASDLIGIGTDPVTGRKVSIAGTGPQLTLGNTAGGSLGRVDFRRTSDGQNTAVVGYISDNEFLIQNNSGGGGGWTTFADNGSTYRWQDTSGFTTSMTLEGSALSVGTSLALIGDATNTAVSSSTDRLYSKNASVGKFSGIFEGTNSAGIGGVVRYLNDVGSNMDVGVLGSAFGTTFAGISRPGTGQIIYNESGGKPLFLATNAVGQDLYLIAAGGFASDRKIKLDGTNGNVTIDQDLTVVGGDITAPADLLVATAAGNGTLQASGNATLSGGSSANVISGGQTLLDGFSGGATIVLTDSMDVSVNNTITLTSDSTSIDLVAPAINGESSGNTTWTSTGGAVNLSAGTVIDMLAGGGAHLEMSLDGSTTILHAPDGGWDMIANSSMLLEAGGDVTVNTTSGGGLITLTAGASSVVLNASSNQALVTGDGGVALSSNTGSDVTIDSDDDVFVTVTDDVAFLGVDLFQVTATTVSLVGDVVAQAPSSSGGVIEQPETTNGNTVSRVRPGALVDTTVTNKPTCSTSIEGSVIFVDDTNDGVQGNLCVCAGTDGASFGWKIVGTTTACP